MKTYTQIEIKNMAMDALVKMRNHLNIKKYTAEECLQERETMPTLFNGIVTQTIVMVNYAIAELNNKGVTDTDKLHDVIYYLDKLKVTDEAINAKKAQDLRKWLAEYEANRPDGCVYSDVAQNGE